MRLVMPLKITGRDLNEHETMTAFSEVLPPYFSPPTSSSVRVGGLVVVGSVVVLIVVPKPLLHPFCLPPLSVCCE